MTKQEKLRDGIKIILQDTVGDDDAITGEIFEYLHSQGAELKVKCPDCEWSQFQDEEAVGMTPCCHCNSTGYIFEPLIERR